ncbi:MAG: trimeric intracellular cation channel family protein [Akkermansia sp.]|nr:trimeric intracellular cation channel family protein [Akkermansia sp.]
MFYLASAATSTLQDVQNFDQHWLFYICCIFATVVGAIAGATASTRVRMDIFGIVTCATIASLGGGTVRDIILNGLIKPNGEPMTVYWIGEGDVQFLYFAIITALIVFYISRFHRLPVGTIRVADAFSMAFFSLLGTAKAHYLGCPYLVSICMGVCTGVAGGVLRDVLTGNVPYVFRPGEIYATASFVGCTTFIILQELLNTPYEYAYIIGVAAVFIIRMIAVYLNWKLPSYRPLFDTIHPSDDPIEKKSAHSEK